MEDISIGLKQKEILQDDLENILNTIPYGVMTLNSGGMITFSNNAAGDILGHDKNELIGKAATDFGLPDLSFAWQKNNGNYSPIPVEKTVLIGPVKHIKLKATPKYQPGTQDIKEILVSLVDISEMIDEIGPDSSSLRISGILEYFTDGFIALDNMCRLIYMNPAAERMTGIKLENNAGKMINEAFADLFCSNPIYGNIFNKMSDKKPMVFEEYLLELKTWVKIKIYPSPYGYSIFFSDITESKKVQDSLAYFASIVNSSNDAIIGLDIKGIITSWNNGATDLYGYTESEAIGKSINIVVPPERRFEVKYYINKILAGKHIYHFETVRATKSGYYIDISLSLSPIKNSKGEIIGISTIARDITESKQAAKNLLESEEKHRSIINDVLENSSVGMFVLDRNYKVIWMNKALEEFFGISREIFIGNDKRELILNKIKYIFEYPDEFSSKVLATYNNNTYIENFYCHVMPSTIRKERWLEHWSQPIRYGLYMGGRVEYYTDITFSKLAEEEIAYAYNMTHQILDKAPFGIYVVDSDGRLEYVNPSMIEMSGDTIEQLRTINVFDLPTYQQIGLSDKIKKALEGESFFLGPVKYTSFYGNKTKIRNFIGIPFNEGNRKRVLIFVQDITRQKLAEEALSEAKMQAELYVDLMGHDINNMNQIAMGYLELASEVLKLDENEKILVQKPYEMMKSSSKLIENVRKLQKVKSSEIKTDRIDLGSIIGEVRNAFKGIPGREVSIEYEQPEGCNVMGNELLKDVFINLVGNSIKHSNGPVWIRISIDKCRECEKDYYKVSVEDNGPGIPDELKSLIFNRSLRGSTKARGSGIGLYLVKTLVENFNGMVWVEDRIVKDRSKGSKFIVMLPVLYEN
jgi:PAS domain S-box-containing protein